MILRPASEIYHDAKSDRKLYVCHNYPACNTYVAAHPNTDKPMGVPANGDLRNLRIQAHRKFDLNGVLMEGYSVEDNGAGICYCVFAYNVQPGVEIDYATGDSKRADSSNTAQTPSTVAPVPAQKPDDSASSDNTNTGNDTAQADYILNTNTKKFHYPTCSSVKDMKDKNKQEFFGTRDEAISNGYSPCGRCKP